MIERVSPNTLKQLLRYEPDTGKLYWRARGAEWFSETGRRTPGHSSANWNARFAGKEAFAVPCGAGYRHGAIMGATLRAHQVIWALVYGEWPPLVDHINGDRSDNRLANLRAVSRTQNASNSKTRSHNRYGLKGVRWWGKRFAAAIRKDGVVRVVGVFDTPEEAHQAYVQASAELHGEFGRAS